VTTVQITDLTTPNGPPYYAGDSFVLTITGTPGQAVTVSLNGAWPPAQYATIPSSGTLTVPGTWGLGDVGDYTQTFYVAGLQVFPGLAFQVRGGQGAMTCGSITMLGTPANQNSQVGWRVPVAGSTNVAFNIAGTNINAYSATVPGVKSPYPYLSSYQAPTNTASLLGAYSVTPGR
jgi:hypothetical protein